MASGHGTWRGVGVSRLVETRSRSPAADLNAVNVTIPPHAHITVTEQTTLQDRLADLTRQQQTLLAELQTLMPPEGKPLA